MSLFNQLLRGGSDYPQSASIEKYDTRTMVPRTFKESINDQIAYHKARIADLESVRDSMSPDVEKFIEAVQRLG